MLTAAELAARKQTVINMYAQGYSRGQIAKVVKSNAFVRQVLVEERVTLTAAERQKEIKAMYVSGYPLTYIAQDLRCSYLSVRAAVNGLQRDCASITVPPLPPRSRRNVRVLAAQGKNVEAICKVTGLKRLQVEHDLA